MTINMLTDGPSKDEVEALISKSNGVLSPQYAASLLRRYDNNFHQAAIAVLDRPDGKLPTRIQTKRPHRIEHGKPEEEPIASPQFKALLLFTFEEASVGPSSTDDIFRRFEMLQSEFQSRPRPHSNQITYTLSNSSSNSKKLEERAKMTQAHAKKNPRLGIQNQDQEQINKNNANTAAGHSNNHKDKQIETFQYQDDELRAKAGEDYGDA